MPWPLEQVAGPAGRQRRQHGEADRAADLEGGVDQAGGEARLLRVTPDIARLISEGNERPAPTPTGPSPAALRSSSCRRPAICENRARPAATETRPGSSVARAPKRRFSFAEKPSERVPIDRRHREEREAHLERVEAEHALQVEGAEEEHPEHPGDHQRLDRIGAGEVPRAEDPQRHQRVGRPRLAGDEAGEQGERRRRRSRACGPSPSRSWWPRRSRRRRASARETISSAPGTSAPWRSPRPRSARAVAEREDAGDDRDRQVDEEDPVPVDRLR